MKKPFIKIPTQAELDKAVIDEVMDEPRAGSYMDAFLKRYYSQSRTRNGLHIGSMRSPIMDAIGKKT